MGRVYRGFDPLVRRAVAIKTIKSEYLTRDTRDEYLRRFRREAQAAGSLSHPNIVSIFDVADDFIVMEFVEGVTLSDLIKHKGPLEMAEALRILAPVAEAIDYAHRAGVVHRDIKPANIMAQPDGRPKLMDFGVARLESTAMTAAGHFFGSPSYMAPEQILSAEITSRADLFSFAVVAYETLTGKRPFQGESVTSIIYKVVNAPATPPSAWNAGLPAFCDEVFARALAKDPAGRFPSASAFVAALQGQEFEFPLAEALLPEAAAEASASVPVEEVETQALKPEAVGPGMLGRYRVWLVGGAGLFLLAAAIVYPRRVEPPSTTPATGGAAASAAAPAAKPAAEPLRIETVPAGAVVWLDGRRRGQTPLELPDVPAGSHQMRVAESGYAPTDFTFELAEGVAPGPWRFNLVPLRTPLSVRSDPPGAGVVIDGRPAGVTPLKAAVGPGRHELRLDNEGFLSYTQRLEARIGQPLEVHAKLQPVPLGGPQPTARPQRHPIRAPVVEGDLVDVDLDPSVTKPRLRAGEAPPYPDAARRLRLGGIVKVEFTIDGNGEARDFHILESAGAVLDETVIETLQGWRYEPARKNGIKVRVRQIYEQTFRPPDA